MDSRRVERVEDWDSRPFSGGFEELRSLADTEFTGAVTTGTTWLFMLNGRIVGVFDGTIDDFDGSSGTTYEAPHPSVPLLFAMQETGGEERANYYTNDTPISEANSTLTSGKFTGYIELSENVLSGDYYVVYYGGRSMSCAFIGNRERLHTGDEAFDRADDEVGIYTVMDVDIEVTEIPGGEPEPEPATDPGDAATGAAAGGGAAGTADAGTDHAETDAEPSDEPVVADPAPSDSADPTTEATTSRERGQPADESTVTEATAPAEPVVEEASSEQAEPAQPDPSHEQDQPRTGETEAHPSENARDDSSRPTPSREPTTDPEGQADATDTTAGPEATPAGTATKTVEDDHDPVQIPDEVLEEVEREAAEEDEDPVFEEEAEWRETRSIPSINPDRSESTSPDPTTRSSTAQSSTSQSSTANRQSRRQRQGATDTQQSSTGTPNGSRGANGSSDQQSNPNRQPGRTEQQATNTADSRSPDEPLEREMLQREDKIDRLQQQLSNVEDERTELREERDQLAEENAELRRELEDLETQITELEAQLTDLESELAAQRGPAADASTQLTSQQALEGTNLFVRYGSKGEATLDAAHGGEADADAVNTNLRIEHHTQFEADDAAVDGRPYVDFLHDSIEFQFVEWFVRDLLYEIRDTGNASPMRDLYDAIPEADRAELQGSVSLRYDEDGNEQREQTTFDVVVRDRMGNPLVVANLNDSRDPTTEGMMVDLQERASRVKRTSESLAGAVVVTASFFDPGALETASEATSGSFLSRDSKKSFVKLSRKSGYHLCLVESRGGEFHINVPEL
jgi:regulator of replication initiation timing